MAEAALNPAELSKDQFLRLVDSLQGQATMPAKPDTQTFLPEAQAAIDQASKQLPRIDASKYVSPEGKRMGMRPGAFLDITTGADAGTRFKMGLDPNQLNQFKLLNQIYGPGNVDLSDEGRFIVRNQGADKKQDIMVDPIGMDRGDAAEMSSQIGPMIAGLIAARFGGRAGTTGVGKVLAGTTAMALGTELTGAVQDGFVRWLRNNDKNLPEIAKRRAAQAVADEVFGLAAAGTAKAGLTAAEGVLGLGGITTGQTATSAARDALAKQTGVKVPLTPGQQAESKLLMRVEAMAGGRPGSAGMIDKMAQAQQDAVDELRRHFLGLPKTMSDAELAAALPQAEVTGAGALRRLRTEADRLAGNTEAARRNLLQTGTREAQQVAGVDLANPLSSTSVGEAMRNRTVQEFAAGHNDFGNRYDAFLSQPEIQARTVAGRDLATAAKAVEKEFVPAAERTVEQVDYDAYGNPITRDVQRTEALNKFVDAKFRGFLDELKSLQNAKVSVNDLKRIRTSIDNSIKEGVAIPGVDTAQLQNLRSAVDDNIATSLKGMPDAKFATEWDGLRKDYATFQQRFDKVGIRDMLIREGEKGSIGNTALAESVTGSSPNAVDRFNAFKDFFGEKSPEFQQLRSIAKQDVLSGSLNDSGYIEGSKLRSNLLNMRPEIARDLFGLDRSQLTNIGKVLDEAQGARLDVAELAKHEADGTLTASTIRGLIDAEETRAAAYNNKLIKAAAKGTLGSETIKPSEFVRYASNMDAPEAQRVMGILSDRPDLTQQIRQLAIEDIWGRVQAGVANKQRISSTLVDQVVGGDSAQERTWRAIIGDEGIDGLKKLADTLRSGEFSAKEFRGASQIAGATDLQKLFLHGEVGAVPAIVGRMLTGFLYSGPLRRSITNMMTSTDNGRLLNAIVGSEPFIREALSRYGSDGAMPFFAAARAAIEPLQKRQMFVNGDLKTGVDPASLSKDEFMKWMSGPGVAK